jgi:cysteine desulfurase / selenocysteine lyase
VAYRTAIEYLQHVGLDTIAAHEHELLDYATSRAKRIPGLRVYGTGPHKAGVLSFTMDGVHPHDIGTILDTDGIAIRAGHHCAQPLMQHFGIPSTARASFYLYNTHDEVDVLMRGLERVHALFS